MGTVKDESENLFSHFIRYTKEKNGETSGFSKTVQAFYNDVLNMECDSNDRAIRSSLTKRFRKLMKRHSRDDPKYQIPLDEFLF